MSSVAVAAAEPLHQEAVRFSVQAQAEPGVLPRLVEVFAKRGLVPRRWLSTTTGPGNMVLTIDLEITGLEADSVDYVAACLRQIVGVETVLTA